MGLTFEVNTLDELCALMCDNRIPRKKNMNIPKYIKGIIERSEFVLGSGYPGYTIKIHKASYYTHDNAINNEAERLCAWARKNGSPAYINKYVRGTHYCDQTVILTIFDPVMKYIEPYMNYNRKTKYGSFTGNVCDLNESIFGEVYCPLNKLDEALDNIILDY